MQEKKEENNSIFFEQKKAQSHTGQFLIRVWLFLYTTFKDRQRQKVH